MKLGNFWKIYKFPGFYIGFPLENPMKSFVSSELQANSLVKQFVVRVVKWFVTRICYDYQWNRVCQAICQAIPLVRRFVKWLVKRFCQATCQTFWHEFPMKTLVSSVLSSVLEICQADWSGFPPGAHWIHIGAIGMSWAPVGIPLARTGIPLPAWHWSLVSSDLSSDLSSELSSE